MLLLCVIDRGSFMENFFGKTGGMTAAERGDYLENPPAGAPDIDDAHEVNPPPQTRMQAHMITSPPSPTMHSRASRNVSRSKSTFG